MDKKKECKQCGKIKPLTAFHRTNGNKSGRMAKCKTCHAFNCHLYYLKNTQKCIDNFQTYYHNNKEKHFACCKNWKKRNKWSSSYSDHKRKAKERGQQFNLTGQDVKELFAPPKICAVSGKKLKHNKTKAKSDSPCMCRKDFSKGYTKETVQLLSKSETMKRFGKYWRKKRKNPTDEKKN